LSKLTAQEDFEIGYYLTSKGFMVISALKNEAVLLITAEGRENTGKVLRLTQQLVKDYKG